MRQLRRVTSAGGLGTVLLAAVLIGCGSGGNGGEDDDAGDAAGPRDAAAADGHAGDGLPRPDSGGEGDGGTGDGGATWWVPPVGATWQWQLDTPVDQTVSADVFDIDLFDNAASVVSALHAKGAKVICYVSVGSWEDWRDDAGQFPSAVLGNDYEGWAGEKWLDIRRIDLLGPIMGRASTCAATRASTGSSPTTSTATRTTPASP